MKQGSMVKRTLAALLCLVLVLSFVPGNLFTAYAAEADSTLWQQIGEIDKTTGGKWEKAGYGDVEAVLLGWNKATAENDGVLGYYVTNAGTGINGNNYRAVTVTNEDGSTETVQVGVDRYSAQLHVRNSGIKANVAAWTPGNYWAFEATRTDANDRLIANLDAPAGYTGVVPQYNTYASECFGYEGTADANLKSSVKPTTEGATHRHFVGFTGLDANKTYTFTVYTDTANFANVPNGVLEFSFLSSDRNTLLSENYVTTNTNEFEGGAYISFKVKGDFYLCIDKGVTRFGLSAFFFDEYVEPEALPENVLPEALTDADLWKQVGEVDNATGGAWQSMGGYGDDLAVLFGYSALAISERAAGNPVVRDKKYDVVIVNGEHIEMTDANKGTYSNMFNNHANSPGNYVTYDGAPLLEKPAGYTGEVPAFATYQSGGFVPADHSLMTKWATSVPACTEIDNCNRMVYTSTSMDADKYYLFTIYADSYRRSREYTDQICFSFTTSGGATLLNRTVVDGTVFGKNGGYITFLVKGAFDVVIEFNSGIERFGPSAVFFDEYVAPAAPVTPEAPVTYENWAQVGEIDTTTGGKWQTKGYGDEQAIITGWSSYYYQDDFEAAIEAGTATSSTRKGQTSNGAFYHVKNTNQDIWMPNVDGKANGTTAYPNASTRLALETWMYVGSDAAGNVTGIPALEIPANYRTPTAQDGSVYTGSQTPVFNGYTVNGRPNTAEYNDVFLFDENPLSGDMTKRLIMTFTVPEAKQDNEYYFSIYADTRNLSTNMAQDFELSFMTLDGTAAEGATITKHRFNTADFGKAGAYVTFKVQGSFLLCYDAPDAADRFGFSGFFFNTQPVKAEPVEEVWTQLGQVDNTTGRKWQTAGYGDVLAALFGWGDQAGSTPSTSGSNRYIGRGNERTLYVIGGSTFSSGNNNYIGYVEASGYIPGNQRVDVLEEGESTNLETPNGYEGVVPTFNTYQGIGASWNNLESISVSATDTKVATLVANGGISDWVPEDGSKKTGNYMYQINSGNKLDAGKKYVLTVYADTLYTGDFTKGGVRFSFTDADNTKVYNQVVVDHTAFNGSNGGYVSFLVQGAFDMIVEFSTSAQFGISALFIDEYETPALDEVESASITLDGTIGVNYGVNFNNVALEDAGAKMVLTHGDEVVNVSVADAVNKNQLKWFSKGVAAKEMADVITAQMHYSDGSKGDANEYSVQKYAETVLNTTTVTAEMKELLVRMLNYGAFSQKYFGYNTANLANSALTNEAKASGLATVSTEHLQKYLASCDNGTAVKLASASLLLKSETTLRLFFAKSAASGKTFKLVTASGEETLTTATRGSYTYVDIENIAAAELDNVYTVNIYEGDTLVSTVKYCAMAYIYNVISNSSNADLINVSKALYLYYQAADNYFA